MPKPATAMPKPAAPRKSKPATTRKNAVSPEEAKRQEQIDQLLLEMKRGNDNLAAMVDLLPNAAAPRVVDLDGNPVEEQKMSPEAEKLHQAWIEEEKKRVAMLPAALAKATGTEPEQWTARFGGNAEFRRDGWMLPVSIVNSPLQNELMRILHDDEGKEIGFALISQENWRWIQGAPAMPFAMMTIHSAHQVDQPPAGDAQADQAAPAHQVEQPSAGDAQADQAAAAHQVD